MMGETRENRLKRMKMRAAHRGTKEMDIILGNFARARLGSLGGDDLDLMERLMAENDHDIYQWVSGQKPVPEIYAMLIGQIAGDAGI